MNESELRAKLEALATEYESRSFNAFREWLLDETRTGLVVSSKVWHWAADDIRQLLAEDAADG